MSGFGCGTVLGYVVSVLLTPSRQSSIGPLTLPTSTSRSSSTTSSSSSSTSSTATTSPTAIPVSSSSNLSKGAIAGIAVGCALAVAIVAAILGFFCFRRYKRRHGPSTLVTSATPTSGWNSQHGYYHKENDGDTVGHNSGSEPPYSMVSGTERSTQQSPIGGFRHQSPSAGYDRQGGTTVGYEHQGPGGYEQVPVSGPMGSEFEQYPRERDGMRTGYASGGYIHRPIPVDGSLIEGSPPPQQQHYVAELGPSNTVRQSK